MTRASWFLALVLLCLPAVGALGPVEVAVEADPAQVAVAAVQVDAPLLPPLAVQAPLVNLGVAGGTAPHAAAPHLLSSDARPSPQLPSLAAKVGAFSALAALVLGLGTFLFSRIDGEALLENPVRQRVLETIRDGPGVCIGEVRDRTGVAWGTAVYHLHRLERSGVVVSVRQKGARRYFAANTQVSRHRTDIAALAHPTAQRIAHLVHRRPGIDQSGVCRELGLQNPAASKHLGRFQSLGLVTAQRAGRSRLYQGTAALEQALTALSLPDA
ncbi:MAG: hypothetical protein QOG31_765 [Thermoplasmata archaeon]|jgi:predicted transcriptional regulator|nr:hypothetical protein [Thermoplasmata archaeon]